MQTWIQETQDDDETSHLPIDPFDEKETPQITVNGPCDAFADDVARTKIVQCAADRAATTHAEGQAVDAALGRMDVAQNTDKKHVTAASHGKKARAEMLKFWHKGHWSHTKRCTRVRYMVQQTQAKCCHNTGLRSRLDAGEMGGAWWSRHMPKKL